MADYLSSSEDEFDNIGPLDLVGGSLGDGEVDGDNVQHGEGDDLHSDISVLSDSEPSLSLWHNEPNDLPDTVPENGDAVQSWDSELKAVKIADFQGQVGGRSKLAATKKELDFFYLMFPEMLIQYIAAETNRYAEQKIEQTPDDKWRATNLAEIRAFIGIQLVMGLVPASNVRMFWTSDNLYKSTGISELLPRDRWEKLSEYFHVNDTSSNPAKGEEGHDNLAQLRNVLEMLEETFKYEYSPHRDQCIEQVTVDSTGRFALTNQVPALKPRKRKATIWMRCDPLNGYMHELKIDTGQVTASESKATKPKATKMVKDLTRDLVNRPHHVYMDERFSSLDLFTDLYKDDIMACGAVSGTQSGFPQELTKTSLTEEGQFEQRRKDNVLATVWRFNKQCGALLSTNSDPTNISTVNRPQKDGTIKELSCPEVVQSYLRYMDGFDNASRLQMSYNIGSRARKWWKYILWFLIDVSASNAFVLMQESPNHQLKQQTNKLRTFTPLKFRTNLARQLIGDYVYKRKLSGIPNCEPSTGMAHWPTKLDKKRTCKFCTKKGSRSEIITGCRQCNVNLCVGCMEPYHLKLWPVWEAKS